MDAVRGDWQFTRDEVQAFFEHHVGTAVALFARLEPNHDVALEAVAVRVQQVCSTNRHGHVQVVAACVHKAVRRCELEACVFDHSECVGVGAQQDGWPGLVATDQQGGTTRAPAAEDLAEPFARREAALGRLRILQAELRHLVEFAADPRKDA